MIPRFSGLIAGLVLAGACGATVAADAAAVQPSSSGGLLQAVFGLVVVLVMLYGFFWLLRRFGPGQMGGQGVVKVVGGVMLSPRERLVIVEVQDSWLLLGVASGNVNLLHTLDKPAGVDVPSNPITAPFADKLSELLRRPAKD